MEAIEVMRSMRKVPSWELCGLSPFEFEARKEYDKRVPTELDALFMDEDSFES